MVVGSKWIEIPLRLHFHKLLTLSASGMTGVDRIRAEIAAVVMPLPSLLRSRYIRLLQRWVLSPLTRLQCQLRMRGVLRELRVMQRAGLVRTAVGEGAEGAETAGSERLRLGLLLRELAGEDMQSAVLLPDAYVEAIYALQGNISVVILT